MKVKELINKLNQFNPELEVTITDGFKYRFYGTKNITINEIAGRNQAYVDIGIGGNELSEEDNY